ncbi:MAG TPA: alpha/beta hydrolase [Usitatibacter sp.]|nr:alpha/beta hydrolase [Usitatibacter sp.]
MIGASAWLGDLLSRPAPLVIGAPPADFAATTVTLHGETGAVVSGWLVRGQEGRGAILLLHGVRANRLQMMERARYFNAMGYSVLLIDMPAHGASPGERITFGAHEARGVSAALAYLHATYPGQKIGVIGVSMGAAALVLARPRTPELSAVVLESMYPTIEEAVADRIAVHVGKWATGFAPLLLWQLPLRTGVSAADLRPIAGIGAIHAPLLIAAGSNDLDTTLAETRRIFAAANAPKELWIVDGAGHEDLFHSYRSQYEARVGGFVREHLR